MSTSSKWDWEDHMIKEPKEMPNDGMLMAEQRSNNTIEDIVTEMIMNGKMAELARYRNASAAKSAEEAYEQATKLPSLISPLDIEEAKQKLNNMNDKINQYIEEEKKYMEMVEEVKNNSTENVAQP